MLRKDELAKIAEAKHLSLFNAERDYLLEVILFALYTNMKNELIFKGGTAMYKVYKLNRFSEDLDFTGGNDFSRDNLAAMGQILTACLNEKYNLRIHVSEPVKDLKNVDTWKIKIETKPKQKHL
ncbi:MAG: nucleotidyl transferase AbiEii/AbiGii toxin family protein, partial [Nanoarchaeota archaeon]